MKGLSSQWSQTLRETCELKHRLRGVTDIGGHAITDGDDLQRTGQGQLVIIERIDE